MTTSDPRDALDRIKSRTEEQPEDSGSAVELSELLDVARDHSLRLTEALEAVLEDVELWDRTAAGWFEHGGKQEAFKARVANSVTRTVRDAIENKINEEER